MNEGKITTKMVIDPHTHTPAYKIYIKIKHSEFGILNHTTLHFKVICNYEREYYMTVNRNCNETVQVMLGLLLSKIQMLSTERVHKPKKTYIVTKLCFWYV